MVTLLGADGRVKNVESPIATDVVRTTDISALGTAAAEDPPSLDPLNQHAQTEVAIGVYLQQTMNPVKWLGFNVGARLDADERYGVHAARRPSRPGEAPELGHPERLSLAADDGTRDHDDVRADLLARRLRCGRRAQRIADVSEEIPGRAERAGPEDLGVLCDVLELGADRVGVLEVDGRGERRRELRCHHAGGADLAVDEALPIGRVQRVEQEARRDADDDEPELPGELHALGSAARFRNASAKLVSYVPSVNSGERMIFWR